ncbi:hypothetical protein [Novosphingobium sp. fls2-241-R2A-195]|uniref:hypothetical protein n=1 Tax=Novosphingobium sp. fls2-241-R2A-195 TaxID=3040296 RepID=UPI00254D3FC8|nr:hypothetical protein [Novosphingobium sp. fls2-241-R2A-195]
MTRRLNLWLLSVLLIIAIPYYWFLADAGVGPGKGEPKAKPLTIGSLRALAEEGDGQRPIELRVETVGMRMTSRNMLMAGGGLRQIANVIRAYELIVPGSEPIVIDAGITRPAAKEHELEIYDGAAQARIQHALSKAAHVVLLADKPTHNGGHPTGTRRAENELQASGDAPYTLAPGVVVIPASSVAPEAKMVYVRLADDREYLFTGDIAKLAINWKEQRLPARIATRGEIASFRSETMSWLMTINALHRAAPQMTIVAGHEPSKIPFSAGTFSD